jgi:hypothetical protein
MYLAAITSAQMPPVVNGNGKARISFEGTPHTK